MVGLCDYGCSQSDDCAGSCKEARKKTYVVSEKMLEDILNTLKNYADCDTYRGRKIEGALGCFGGPRPLPRKLVMPAGYALKKLREEVFIINNGAVKV